MVGDHFLRFGIIEVEKTLKSINTPILTSLAKILDCCQEFQDFFFEEIQALKD